MKKRKVLSFVVLALVMTAIVISFAIVTQAKETKRAFLGVILTDLDQDLRQTLKYNGEGVFVKEVVDDSPAEEAGIKDGDIITKFDGKVAADEASLKKLIKDHSPGDKVEIIVMRDGKSQALKAELGKNKDIEIITSIGEGDPLLKMRYIDPGIGTVICLSEDCGFLGVKLQDMSGQLAEYFGVKNGALIGEVIKESPAEKAGLKAGDIVTEFDGKRVDDQEDLRYYLKKTKPEEEYSLKFSRKGAAQSLKVKLGKAPDCEKGGCHEKCLKMMQSCKDKEIELKCLEEKLKDLEDLPVNIEEYEEDGKKVIKVKVGDD